MTKYQLLTRNLKFCDGHPITITTYIIQRWRRGRRQGFFLAICKKGMQVAMEPLAYLLVTTTTLTSYLAHLRQTMLAQSRTNLQSYSSGMIECLGCLFLLNINNKYVVCIIILLSHSIWSIKENLQNHQK